jgi:hypothetical protein
MLHACVQRFDVTDTAQTFFFRLGGQLNRLFVLRSSELATLAAIFHFRYPARFFSFSHVMTRVVTSTVMFLFYSILPVVCVVTTLPTDAY